MTLAHVGVSTTQVAIIRRKQNSMIQFADIFQIMYKYSSPTTDGGLVGLVTPTPATHELAHSMRATSSSTVPKGGQLDTSHVKLTSNVSWTSSSSQLTLLIGTSTVDDDDNSSTFDGAAGPQTHARTHPRSLASQLSLRPPQEHARARPLA